MQKDMSIFYKLRVKHMCIFILSVSTFKLFVDLLNASCTLIQKCRPCALTCEETSRKMFLSFMEIILISVQQVVLKH